MIKERSIIMTRSVIPVSEFKRGTLAWVRKPIINMEKPTVVDEDDLLMKVDSMKAKPI